MSDLALDITTHDLVVVQGDFALVENSEDVAQAIKIRLLIFLNEWFLDTTLGVEYFKHIFEPNRSYGLKSDELRRVVQATPGVKDVRSLTFDVDTASHFATVNVGYQDDFGNIASVST